VKTTLTKLILAKTTLAKGKRKAIEYEANIEPDYTIETITLTTIDLGIYYEEVYYIG